jgi:hypothetical protein
VTLRHRRTHREGQFGLGYREPKEVGGHGLPMSLARPQMQAPIQSRIRLQGVLQAAAVVKNGQGGGGHAGGG